VRLDSNVLGRVLLQLAVGVAHWSGIAHAEVPCKTPTYVIAAEYDDPVAQVVGYMHVSVPPGDFTRANLVCIAHAIRESRPSDAPLMVMFFASLAAVEEIPDVMASPLVNKFVRAVYVLQPEKPHERLTLTPLGYGAGALSDDDSAPEMDDDRCESTFDGRCLLACDVPPDQADGFTGSVLLSARLQKAGTFDQVRILQQATNNTVPASTIARAAVNNLKSLWFEPSDRDRRVRVTYRFGVGAARMPQSDFVLDYTPEQAIRFRLIR
jgi:hypothetical protein